jgi:hypothetical protein
VLKTLAEKGILSPRNVEQLLEANIFLRNLEHRLQYLEDAQTHTLPSNAADQHIVANMMGMADVPSLLEALEVQRRLVAAQFDAIFNEKDDVQDASGAPAGPTSIDLQMFANLPMPKKRKPSKRNCVQSALTTLLQRPSACLKPANLRACNRCRSIAEGNSCPLSMRRCPSLHTQSKRS